MKVWFPAIKASSGADVFILRLASALKKRGIEVEVSWFNKNYEFFPLLLGNKPAPKNTDIIHTNSWNGFAFNRPDVPLIVTEHHCVFDPFYRPFKSLYQNLYHKLIISHYEMASFRKCDAVTAVSNFTCESLNQYADLKNVQCIYNWVDIAKFKPSAPQKNGTPKRFNLLYVGNVSRRKGFDLLEPIMSKLGEDFVLRFTTGLRNIKKQSYPSNMMPLGNLNEKDLIKEYQECDALLFPSRFEGFGYVALEAMACGKPVIATDATSIPEVVDNGVTGILCPIDDIDAFVSACRKLAADRKLCERFGKAGRKRAEEIFSEEMILSQYIDLYRSLLAK